MEKAKYHRSTDGKYRPCQAKTACPLGGEHLDRSEAMYKQNVEAQKGRSDAIREIADQVDVTKPHWRLHRSPRDSQVTAVCVQDFDYRDYNPANFIEAKAYDTSIAAKYSAETFNLDGQADLPRKDQERLANLKRGSFHAYSDVINQLDDFNEVHWRLYYSTNTGEVTPICVQYFDYVDYDQECFMGTKAYKSVEEAEAEAPSWN